MSKYKTSFLIIVFNCIWFAGSTQYPFIPIDTNYISNTIFLSPTELQNSVLFRGGFDYVSCDEGTDTALSKINLDFIGVIPIEDGTKENWIVVNHEIANTKNTKLGDGGGQTMFKIHKTQFDTWEVIPSLWGKKFINIDFSKVGGTNRNCGGDITLNGNILSAEEFPTSSNAGLFSSGAGFSDTSDFYIPPGNGIYSGNILPRWKQMGWIVEINPDSAKATRKFYSMGRMSHEDLVIMQDGKTIYFTEDNTPGMLYKFISEEENYFVEGALYVYAQTEDGNSGNWILLPQQLDSLLMIHEIAVKRGATIFTRLEGICVNTNQDKLYFSETGSDDAVLKYAMFEGGKVPVQTQFLDTFAGAPADSIYQDYFGRIWELDLNTLQSKILIEGGNNVDGSTNFSNPDNLSFIQYGENYRYLFIQEDLNGISLNRQPPHILNGINVGNEIFCLDLNILNPQVDDLKRFGIGPKGSETSGITFSKNGNVLFANMMHPNVANTFPYNYSSTVAISGLRNFLISTLDSANTEIEGEIFADQTIYPNPTHSIVFLQYQSNVEIFNISGALLFQIGATNELDFSTLPVGVYFIRINGDKIYRVIKK